MIVGLKKIFTESFWVDRYKGFVKPENSIITLVLNEALLFGFNWHIEPEHEQMGDDTATSLRDAVHAIYP